MIAKHIVESIDDAIRNEWIKVYYQPVIRSLTGELCGFESLARWIDPEFGFLSPAQFIGALEEAELICKLDIYMIKKVCSDIHDRLENGQDIVPVSINFSRLDFLTCDMLEEVEAIVNEYDIPRDYLHVEITESMMVTDGEFMHDVIDGFRNQGYAVWMDDFGSGYSSLNLLKDFTMDMLKMDMKFLSSMNPKSKAIMNSVISMAKDVGIQTLAEGVETQEEVEFLKEIGCGRLQGYFYGKPLPLEEAFENLRSKGIKTEKRKWHHFYDVAGTHVRKIDTPLELLFDDGNEFKTLFMNDAYKLQIFDDLPTLEEADNRIYKTGSPLLMKYREFANTIEMTKKPQAFYYTVNGKYLCFRGREVAECEGCHIIKGSIQNISADANIAKSEELDTRLRELNHLFAVVLNFCPEEERVTPVLGKFKLFHGPEQMNMRQSTVMMANAAIHPEDRQRFIEFMNFETFSERLEKTGMGLIEEAFRFKSEVGVFVWAVATIMVLPGTSGKEFMYCVKPIQRNAAETIMAHGAAATKYLNPDEYSLLWYNILTNSSIKFFWKDNDRRFLGASKAFYDYFKIESPDDLIGKRGEEMPWHLENTSYSTNEAKVLRKGATLNVTPCQCIINGVVHNTVTSKLPIYKDGEIVGIMGYIIDVDDARRDLGFNKEKENTDRVTGLPNLYAFVQSLVDYANQYESNNRDYGLIVLKNAKYKRIIDDFGIEFSDSVIQAMAEAICDVVEDRGTVARTRESYFAILVPADSVEELNELNKEIRNAVESIVSVDGRGVTIKMASVIRLRSEGVLTDESIYVSALEELRKI